MSHATIDSAMSRLYFELLKTALNVHILMRVNDCVIQCLLIPPRTLVLALNVLRFNNWQAAVEVATCQ